ncbi:MAG: FG-GAP-like repeat-containing protein [Flavobacteriales bacterium]
MQKLLHIILFSLVAISCAAQDFERHTIIGNHEIDKTISAMPLDWDEDGDLDLLNISTLRNNGLSSLNRFTLIKNNGIGDFDEGTIIWKNGLILEYYNFEIPELLKYQIRFGDLDQDGKREMILGNGAQNSIIVVPFEADGENCLYTIIPLGYDLEYILSECYFYDFDNDGDLDISAISKETSTPELVWLVNNGNNLFDSTSPRPYTPYNGTIDLDNDGDLDCAYQAILPGSNASRLALRENVGNGLFGPEILLSDVAHSINSPVGFMDLNNDGLIDLYSHFAIHVTARLNLGNFTFGIPFDSNSTFPDYAYTLSTPPTFADYNEDGFVDLLYRVPNSASEMQNICYVLVNDGAGAWPEYDAAPYDELAFIFNSAIADIDNDGLADCISAKTNELNSDLFWQEDINHGVLNARHTIKMKYLIENVIAGDFDGDGHEDLFTYNRNYQENQLSPDPQYCYLNTTPLKIMGNGTGNFEISPLEMNYILSGNQKFGCFFALDIDNDNKDEVFLKTADENAVYYLLSYNSTTESLDVVFNFTSNFADPNYESFNLANNPLVCDLNGDNLSDFILTSEFNYTINQNINYFINNGNNSFTEFAIDPSQLTSTYNIKVINVDTDPQLEIVLSNNDGIYKQDIESNGNLSAPARIFSSFALIEGSLGQTQNGYPILCAGVSGYVSIMNGTITGDTGAMMVLQSNNAGEYGVVKILNSFYYNQSSINQDIDDDGNPEIIYDYGSFLGLENDEFEFGTFDNPLSYGFGFGGTINSMQDFNEDDAPDLGSWKSAYDYLVYPSLTGPYYPKMLFWIEHTAFQGCTDPMACNYNGNATSDDGSCCYTGCGCMDPGACNYDPNATCENGSCTLAGCTDILACNYNPNAMCDDGSCIVGSNLTVSLTQFGNLDSANLVVPSLLKQEILATDYFTAITGQYEVNESTSIGTYNCVPNECIRLVLGVSGSIDSTDGIHMVITDQTGLEYYNDSLMLHEYIPFNWTPELPQHYIEELCICSQGSVIGCTDELASNYNPAATCEINSCIYPFTGRVFFDENLNGYYDANDYGLPFQQITVNPGNILLITDNNGFFTAFLSDNDDFIISHVADPNFPYYTSFSEYYTIDFDGQGGDYSFGLSIEEPNFDIEVNILPDFYVCNSYVNFNLCFRNLSNVPLDGVLAFAKDDSYLSYQAITPIDSIVGDYFYFSFDSLMPGQMSYFTIALLTPTADFISESYVNALYASGYSDGNLVAIGNEVETIVHNCSYDPNDKTGDPLGYTESHFIEDGTAIEYLVRFQNTGTAPALNVFITDILDSNLEIESFELVANSHSVAVSVNPETRELEFYFANIMLPDSVSDSEGSNGFISYRVNLLPVIDAGTEIHNTAYIYFDNNDPVITNTTLHTIFDCNQYESNIQITSGEDCTEPTAFLHADVLWTEEFTWLVDGAEVSNEQDFPLSTPGSHEVTLTIGNPLCGSRTLTTTAIVNTAIDASIVTTQWEICPGESTELTASLADQQYAWYLDGDELGSTQSVSVSEAGTVELIITTDDCTISESGDVILLPQPEVTSINQSGNMVTLVNNDAWDYLWSLNGIPIPNATNSSLEIIESGTYSCQITLGACAIELYIDATFNSININLHGNILVYPNPANELLVLECPAEYLGSTAAIYNSNGKLISENKITSVRYSIEVQKWAAGIYNLCVVGADQRESLRFIVSH